MPTNHCHFGGHRRNSPPDSTHNVIAYIRPKKSFVWPMTDAILVRCGRCGRCRGTFSSPFVRGNADEIEFATVVGRQAGHSLRRACCVAAASASYVNLQSVVTALLLLSASSRVSIRRGGITRSNGKWSKELAIMDNGLIGKRSNWIML